MAAFWTYVLESLSGKGLYTGHTQDVEQRLAVHNQGRASYTSRGVPWRLMYSRGFDSRKQAIAHEREIKKIGARSFLKDGQIWIGCRSGGMADALDSKSSAFNGRVGSTPTSGTRIRTANSGAATP